MPRKKSPPTYRHHKARDCAVVTIAGRNHYLGSYGSPASQERYARLIAELHVTPAVETAVPLAIPSLSLGTGLTINGLVNAYRKFAETYYVRNGQPTKELADMKYAARPLRALYGSSLARDFGPLALKAVREHMIAVEDLSRGVVNSRINRIKRIFKWAVSEELVPPSAYWPSPLKLNQSG